MGRRIFNYEKIYNISLNGTNKALASVEMGFGEVKFVWVWLGSLGNLNQLMLN